MDDSNKLYILQARPLTALKKYKPVDELDLPIILKGRAASFGMVSGKVRHVASPDDLETIQKGEILVTTMTTPDYVPVFDKIGGLVTAQGGTTCHAAIVSREYNLPCVVGVGDVMSVSDKQEVTVDGSNGLVYDGKNTGKKPKKKNVDIIKEANKIETLIEPEILPIADSAITYKLVLHTYSNKICAIASCRLLNPSGLGLIEAKNVVEEIHIAVDIGKRVAI